MRSVSRPSNDASPDCHTDKPGCSHAVGERRTDSWCLLHPNGSGDRRPRPDLEDAGLDCDEWEVTVKNVQSFCDDLKILGFSDGTKKRDKLMKASADYAWQIVQDADREDDIAVVVGDNWWMRLAGVAAGG